MLKTLDVEPKPIQRILKIRTDNKREG